MTKVMNLQNHKLFSPMRINGLTVPNRIAMAPMARNRSTDFVPTDEVAAYYARRAKHDVGLIFTEANHIDHPVANGYRGQPAIHGDAALQGHRKIINAVDEAGGIIFCQLWHMGPERPEGGVPNPELPALSPSGLKRPNTASGRAMTIEEILDVQESYVRAAISAQSVGYSGIEIHGAHGYLIDSFMDKETNHRTDRYGGSLKNRIRFAVETIQKVRSAVGKNYPISFRLSQWKTTDYNAKLFEKPDELEFALRQFVDAGVDILHCSTRRFWEPEYDGSDLSFAGWVKKLSGLPVIAVGSVTLNGTFTDVENPEKGLMGIAQAKVDANVGKVCEYIDRGEFDMIAIGRALISNPDWVMKVRSGAQSTLKTFEQADLKTLY